MSRLEGENNKFPEIVKIEETNGKPIINGVPEGQIVLFFAKLYGQFEDGNDCNGEYCVIYGSENCLPHEYPRSELWDAKVAIGRAGFPLEVSTVRHGHKYAKGGGFIDFGEGPIFSCNQIFFRKIEDPEKSTFNGVRIREVFSVL